LYDRDRDDIRRSDRFRLAIVLGAPWTFVDFGFASPLAIDSSTPRPGCGVTAHSYDDALAILNETVFAGKRRPEIEHVVENVEISALDQKHVIPNMEAPTWRGVWYPKGFSQSR
jgi:hypothetical protein